MINIQRSGRESVAEFRLFRSLRFFRGEAEMNAKEEPTDAGIVSDVINLDEVPFSSLRYLGGTELRRSIDLVEKYANRPSKTVTSCSSLATF